MVHVHDVQKYFTCYDSSFVSIPFQESEFGAAVEGISELNLLEY